MLVASLMLAAGAYVTPLPSAPAADDSALARRVRSSARDFFRAWRREWYKGFRDTANNRFRDGAGHCHVNGVGNRYAPNTVVSGTRKAMCPHWYPHPSLERDERYGIDAALTDEARTKIRARRASLLALLDTALSAMPTHSVLHGQRVRFAVDQRDTSRALAALSACPGLGGWCDMLGVYVATQFGDVPRADSLVGRALSAMSTEDKCAWTDLSSILDPGEQSVFKRRDCAGRAHLTANYWWLADPLWSKPGNERRTTHFARLVEVAVRSEYPMDERFDWTPRLGGLAYSRMIMRYGWPSLLAWLGRREDDGHRSYLGFDDQAVTTLSPEYTFPRSHTTPPMRAAVSPSVLQRDDWRDMSPRWENERWDRDWWEYEHMPLEGGPMVMVSDQTAMFRRSRSGIAAIATALPAWMLARSAERYTTSIVIGTGPEAMTTVSQPLPGNGRAALTVPTSQPGVASIEIVAVNRFAFATGRSRYAIIPLPSLDELPRGEIALSELALFAADSSGRAPATLDAMLPHMLPSLEVARGARLGVFWEAYGLASASAVDVMLRVERDDPGIINRILGRGDQAVEISWKEPRAGLTGTDFMDGTTPVQARAMTLGLGALEPGEYTVTLTVARAGSPAAVSLRSFTIR